MSETQMPPVKLPSGDKLNFFLTMLLPHSKTNPDDTFVPDNKPFNVGQACAIAWRVKKWKLTGTVTATYTGDNPDPPTIEPLDLSDADESKTYANGDPDEEVTEPNEMQIVNGQMQGIAGVGMQPALQGAARLIQKIDFANDDWTLSFQNILGFPAPDQTGFNGIYMDDDHKLYLWYPRFTFTDNHGFGISADQQPISQGIDVSPVTCKILTADLNLIGAPPTDWDVSGTINITASEWFTWGGAYSSSTGDKT